MNEMEKSALKHAAEQLRYQRSPQYKIDRENDKRKRAARDKAFGHTPQCSLTRCAEGCRSAI